MFTLDAIRACVADETVLLRAVGLMEHGGVEIRSRGADRLTAVVTDLGRDRHQVEINANLEGRCSCPRWMASGSRRFCEHLAAAGLVWLNTADARGEAAAAATTKRCPFCAETVLAAAIKCKHCGSRLDTTGPVKLIVDTRKEAVSENTSTLSWGRLAATIVVALLVGLMASSVATGVIFSGETENKKNAWQSCHAVGACESFPSYPAATAVFALFTIGFTLWGGLTWCKRKDPR